MADPSQLGLEVAKELLKIVRKGLKLESTAQNRDSAENESHGMFAEIKELARKANIPDQETETLQRIVAEMQKARLKYSKFNWWYYRQKREKAEEAFKDFISFRLTVQTARNYLLDDADRLTQHMADRSSLTSELVKRASKIVDKDLEYRSTAKNLLSMEKELSPVLENIEELERKMDLPAQEIENLQRIITTLREACLKYSKIGLWNICLEPSYQKELEKAEKSAQDFISFWLQVQTARTVMQIRQHQINTADQTNHIGQSEELMSDLEAFPQSTVELSARFKNELKSYLMKDGGDPVLNLYGFAGSGKTTLAKQLCHDMHVRGWFNDNILFVSVGSKIESNGDVATQLQDKLHDKGNNRAVMLVLDDVEPGSEQLVEQCRSQISSNSKSKILVMSRVELPGLGTPVHMTLLGEDDAITLLRHFAQPIRTSSYNFPYPQTLRQVARGCGGFPIVIKLIGSALRGKPIEFWQKLLKQWSQQVHYSLHTHSELLTHLQNSLSVSKDYERINEFFMDLGLFPKNQMIPVTALIYMWAELYQQDEDGIDAMIHIYRLTALNLADTVVKRRIRSDADNYYDNHFVTQHDLLKELANKILNDQLEEVFERKKLMIDINGSDPPKWWPQQPELGNASTSSTQQRVAARLLSMSTDQKVTPHWCNIQADQAEVLILNLNTSEYILPKFLKGMRNLKVLIVTHYGFQFAELKNLELLSFLWALKKIRLQNISVPCLCELKNVQNLSLYMCEVKAFENSSITFSKALPNLVELSIEYCKDLVKLPTGICNIVTLNKLSISNCHKFSELPEEIGNLENLELLRISYCADFEKMPDSIAKLKCLSFLDISYCRSLRQLPDKIGELQNLLKLYIIGCPIRELPDSILDFEHLESLICDEDAYPLWELIKSSDSRQQNQINTADQTKQIGQPEILRSNLEAFPESTVKLNAPLKNELKSDLMKDGDKRVRAAFPESTVKLNAPLKNELKSDLMKDGDKRVPGPLVESFMKQLWKILENGLKYESSAQKLASMEKELSPLFPVMEELARMAVLPPQEIESLQMIDTKMRKARLKYSKIGWRFWRVPYHTQKIEHVEQEVKHFIFSQLTKQMMKMLNFQQTMAADQTKQFVQPRILKSDLEAFPESTPELHAPLKNKLRSDLMKDGGNQVLNLTGLASSGKTTLALQLCRDPLVRDWFEGNVFFMSVGREIESNGDAAKQLQDELREKGNNKAVLLVLDDVEPRSKQLVQQCWNIISSNSISKSKILVISRAAFQGISTDPVSMTPLDEDDAITLLRHFAQPIGTSSYNFPDHHTLRQVVKGCGGFPLATKIIGSELQGKPIVFWKKAAKELSRKGPYSLRINSELLTHLKNSFSALNDYESNSEFFMDLGLFPENQMIPVTALIDMWVELYQLEEDGIDVMFHIHKLTAMNLADNMVVRRRIGSDADDYFGNHFLTQQKILRELAIKCSSEEGEVLERKRLIIEINGNDRPEGWPQQPQQRVAARIVSLSTDQNVTPDWCHIRATQAEVLILDLKTVEHTLPEFIMEMSNLKVFIVINSGFRGYTLLENLELLGCLRTLKRIRLQQVSVPSLGKLKNLLKLSFYKCEVKTAFENSSRKLSKAMPNLVELNFEDCEDLVKLPAGLCDIVTLKKLSINGCHKFTELPKEIGKLVNLELLRISYCNAFEEMPESITELKNLMFLDISHSPRLRILTKDMGKLQNLRKLQTAKGKDEIELETST